METIDRLKSQFGPEVGDSDVGIKSVPMSTPEVSRDRREIQGIITTVDPDMDDEVVLPNFDTSYFPDRIKSVYLDHQYAIEGKIAAIGKCRKFVVKKKGVFALSGLPQRDGGLVVSRRRAAQVVPHEIPFHHGAIRDRVLIEIPLVGSVELHAHGTVDFARQIRVQVHIVHLIARRAARDLSAINVAEVLNEWDASPRVHHAEAGELSHGHAALSTGETVKARRQFLLGTKDDGALAGIAGKTAQQRRPVRRCMSLGRVAARDVSAGVADRGPECGIQTHSTRKRRLIKPGGPTSTVSAQI